MNEDKVPGPGVWIQASEVTKLREAVVAAYVKGWAEGVRSYAIWSDGEQFVGVMHKPLFDVLEEGPDLDILQIRLEEDK